MKKLFLALSILTAFVSCTTEDVGPKTPSEAVVGVYDITYLSVTSGADVTTFASLPATQSGVTYSANVELSSPATGTIDIRLWFKTNGVDDSPSELNGFEVKEKGSAYGLYLADELIADLDGKNIDFNFTSMQNNERLSLIFRAKR